MIIGESMIKQIIRI